MHFDEDAEEVKIRTRVLLLAYAEEAFDVGFKQLIAGKRRFTQTELLDELQFSNLRRFHRKAIWESYKSGRFEAKVSLDLATKY